jgi:exopolysaccharide biosynthesis polyprenyl glycosylphosphotransferase
MYANTRRLHNIIQLIVDLFCFKLIWECSIRARILLNPVMNAHVPSEKADLWVPPVTLILILWLVVSFRLRLYRVPDPIRFWTILVSAFENAALLTTLTAVTTFFSRQFGEFVSRMFVPVMFPVAFILLVLARYLGVYITKLVQGWWDRPLRIALVGDWTKASHLIGRMPPAQGILFHGLIVPEGGLVHALACPMPVLGTTGQIAELINKERLDRVIFLNASLPDVELAHCTQISKRMGVPVSCAWDFSNERVHVDVSTQYGVPFLEMIPVQFTRRQEIVKRVFDVIVSAVSLFVLTPVLLAIAVLIKATSKGPVLYKSPRVGRGGRHFTFLKFRSMYVNNDRAHVAQENEKNGHIFKMRNDPRVTPVGRFLRRYSLDELPQLVNVLLGEMSIVGPRPLPASDLGPDGMSKQFSLWSEGRSRVHPGLTGLWQVSGRSDLAFEDMVRLDLAYIQNWSLALDVRIISDTPMILIRGSGAY